MTRGPDRTQAADRAPCPEPTGAVGPRDLLLGTNWRSDPRNLSELEGKHLPLIRAPETVRKGECFEVSIEVGQGRAHPSEREHFIEFVDLYADDTYLGRVSFTAATTCPRATLAVVLPKKCFRELRACARCNLHGMWSSSRPIAVHD